jgi:GntR family transcriptional regulator
MHNSQTPVSFRIDRSRPLHLEIRQALEEGIEAGTWKPGDRLPSEAEIQRMTGASRTPIRQALTELELEGIIYRAQGRGSYVRHSKMTATAHLSFDKELRRQGHTVITKTTLVSELSADKQIAKELRLRGGSRVIYMQRLVLVDGTPVALFDNYIAPVVPSEGFRLLSDTTGIFDLMADHGYALKSATETIGARLLSSLEAKTLQTRRPSVALTIHRVACVSDGRPMLVANCLILADRLVYHVQSRDLSQTMG